MSDLITSLQSETRYTNSPLYTRPTYAVCLLRSLSSIKALQCQRMCAYTHIDTYGLFKKFWNTRFVRIKQVKWKKKRVMYSFSKMPISEERKISYFDVFAVYMTIGIVYHLVLTFCGHFSSLS